MGTFIAIWFAGLMIGIGIGISINKNIIKTRLKDRNIDTSKFNDIL